MQKLYLVTVFFIFSLCSCFTSSRISHFAKQDIVNKEGLQYAQVGICIYDPVRRKYVYKHEAEKYFTPASNTKLYTFFTGLTLLGDSTSGIFYKLNGDTLYIQGTGDPSVFHPDFADQPVVNFLKNSAAKVIVYTNPVDENEVFGPGWAWNDYSDDYQPERSAMPLYGNVLWCDISGDTIYTMPSYFQQAGKFIEDTSLYTYLHRVQFDNIFYYKPAGKPVSNLQVPFKIFNGRTTANLLQDTLHKPVIYDSIPITWTNATEIKNVPLDSLFKQMLHRSDNFYAEQTLQMCSYKMFDTISTSRVITYMLNNQLRNLPQTPSWVDGSGLSRYNLFTPEDLVWILTKLHNNFPSLKLDSLLPTGGTGTLRHLYQNIQDSIFAKTGSLNNNSALSGYLITRKGHLLIFSILVGNFREPSSEVRKAIEDFILAVHGNY
jgi:serine-type D-Ala-D-Ala carboxypeptidase/endopeptidase (penicillin-binding protein 4)